MENSPSALAALAAALSPGNLAAGGGVLGFAVWLLSKLRRSVAHDSGDVAAHQALQATIKTLGEQITSMHEENTRLQGYLRGVQREVAKLQAENIKLHALAADLTERLMKFSEQAAAEAHADHEGGPHG